MKMTFRDISTSHAEDLPGTHGRRVTSVTRIIRSIKGLSYTLWHIICSAVFAFLSHETRSLIRDMDCCFTATRHESAWRQEARSEKYQQHDSRRILIGVIDILIVQRPKIIAPVAVTRNFIDCSVLLTIRRNRPSALSNNKLLLDFYVFWPIFHKPTTRDFDTLRPPTMVFLRPFGTARWP